MLPARRIQMAQAVTTQAACTRQAFSLDTLERTEFVDITDEVQASVRHACIQNGLVNVQSLHTTASILVNEHDGPLLQDMASVLERLAPESAFYRHDTVGLSSANCVLTERPNGHSHCRALLLAPSVTLQVTNGQVLLGRWQRIFLVELDGPRTREVSVLAFGES